MIGAPLFIYLFAIIAHHQWSMVVLMPLFGLAFYPIDQEYSPIIRHGKRPGMGNGFYFLNNYKLKMEIAVEMREKRNVAFHFHYQSGKKISTKHF